MKKIISVLFSFKLSNLFKLSESILDLYCPILLSYLSLIDSISDSNLSNLILLTAPSAPSFPTLSLKSALISNWLKYFLVEFSNAIVNSFLSFLSSEFSFLSLGITLLVK